MKPGHVHNQRAPLHAPSRTRLGSFSPRTRHVLAPCKTLLQSAPRVHPPGATAAHTPFDDHDSLACCSARLGTAQHGSARLGTARHGTARLGTARLGTARVSLTARVERFEVRVGTGKTQRCHHGCERNTLAVVMVTDGAGSPACRCPSERLHHRARRWSPLQTGARVVNHV